MDISVIIPLYNEEQCVEKAIRAVADFFKTENYEIIAVDDGSTDNTTQIVKSLQKEFSGLRLVALPKNQGKGAAVKNGVLSAQKEWILFLDADLSTDPSELKNFIPFMIDYDIIIGSRAIRGSKILKSQNVLRVLAGKFGNKFIKIFFGLPFNDTQCGFKLFNRRTIKVFHKQTINRWGFDMELLFLAKKYGFRIKEAPVNWTNDERSLVTISVYFKVLLEAINIRWNDLRKKYE